MDKNTTTAPSEAAPVLNSIGGVYFEDNNFEGAIEYFTRSLSLRNGFFSMRQRAEILCNIGSAYCKMRNYKESEASKYFNKALKVSESLDETSRLSLELKATITCNLASVLYKQKYYLRAHALFSDGKNLACRAVNICVIAFRSCNNALSCLKLHR